MEKRKRRLDNRLNAGSMADIAFLLLIFFLVTAAIPKDKGIYRKLPEKCISNDCNTNAHEHNILKIAINAKNDIMINDEITSINAIKNKAKAFIDNNANGECTYCNGNRNQTLSEHPKKAIISLKTDRNANYSKFIKVQDELTKAYLELRTHYCKTVLKKDIDKLSKEELKAAREAYPLILSEADIE